VLGRLVDAEDELADGRFPIDGALVDRDQANAGLPQGMDPVPRLDLVEPAEAGLVPAEDGREVAALAGVAYHLLKLHALVRGVAGDAFVNIPANDVVTVRFGVLRHRLYLVGDRGVLPVRGAACTAGGGNGHMIVS
jgi:hypothetical protein